MKTLTEMNLHEHAMRNRAARFEDFTNAKRSAEERIASLEAQRPDTTLLTELADLAVKVPKQWYTRFQSSSFVELNWALRQVIGAAQTDLEERDGLRQEELTQVRETLAQMTRALAELEAEA
jgi:hypothetical protein